MAALVAIAGTLPHLLAPGYRFPGPQSFAPTRCRGVPVPMSVTEIDTLNAWLLVGTLVDEYVALAALLGRYAATLRRRLEQV